MTEKNKKDKTKAPIAPQGLSSFHMEADRTGRGMSLCICGIIGISELSDCCILLMSHAGRIRVNGSRMTVSVLEAGGVEIIGKVEGIEFKYGKN